MYFLDGIVIPPLVFGFVLLTFAHSITNLITRKAQSDSFMRNKIIRNIFYVWTLRAIGIGAIIASVQGAKNPTPSILKSDESVVSLLELGEIAEGIVFKSKYDEGAPKGWGILYQFVTFNPKTKEKQMYWGGVKGPKNYFAELSPGDKITVIYYPPNPKISSEIRAFLNHPSHKYVFKEAGILHLVDKYRDKYKIKDYELTEWYDSQAEK